MARAKPTFVRACQGCDASFITRSWQASRKYCSRDCRTQHLANFMRHVDDSAGPEHCWHWRGANDGRVGYGRASIQGRTVGAHVAVYLRLVGPIPDGLEIDHLCRNPGCVNPTHMEPVTRRENVLRQPKVIAARAATHCRHGHLWTDANTYRHPNGSRVCRACTANSIRRYLKRKA